MKGVHGNEQLGLKLRAWLPWLCVRVPCICVHSSHSSPAPFHSSTFCLCSLCLVVSHPLTSSSECFPSSSSSSLSHDPIDVSLFLPPDSHRHTPPPHPSPSFTDLSFILRGANVDEGMRIDGLRAHTGKVTETESCSELM